MESMTVNQVMMATVNYMKW